MSEWGLGVPRETSRNLSAGVRKGRGAAGAAGFGGAGAGAGAAAAGAEWESPLDNASVASAELVRTKLRRVTGVEAGGVFMELVGRLQSGSRRASAPGTAADRDRSPVAAAEQGVRRGRSS